MAKVNTRRCVSFNRELYVLVLEAASKLDESASEFVANAVRARLKASGYGRRLPVQHFDGPDQDRLRGKWVHVPARGKR